MAMDDESPLDDLCEEPLVVVVDRWAVILAGPDGVSLALTAEAAAQSARRLVEAAEQAKLAAP